MLRIPLDQPQLKAVGVLELVDHEMGELLPVAVAELRGRAQQLDGLELEVLEVERRPLRLVLLIAGAEAGHQFP